MFKQLKSKLQSRKFWLVVSAFVVLTLLVAAPPLVGLWVLGKPIVVLTGSEYISGLSVVVSAYFAANSWQKRRTEPTGVDEPSD